MAVRDHTKAYLNVRATRRVPGIDEDQGEPSKPKWIEAAQDMQILVDDLARQLAELKAMQGQHLTPSIEEQSEIEALIRNKTTEISNLFTFVKTKVQQFAERFTSQQATTDEDAKVKKNVQSNLALQLADLSSDFKNCQEAYMSGLQHLEKSSVTNPAVFDTPATVSYVNQGFSAQQLAQVDASDVLLRQRAEDIDALARSIVDLATLFSDMQALVIEQGTLLDQIEHNVEEVVVHTQQAVVHLKAAKTSQDSYQKKLCIIVLILVIFCLFIVLMVKPRQADSTTST